MSCIQQNFPSKFEPNDAFYEKLEENTFVAFILRHPVFEWAVMNYEHECEISKVIVVISNKIKIKVGS